MGFQKAVREKVKLKIALIGPSGSGKTYSALKLATGMGGKTAFIDTENDRGLYYANEFEYDRQSLSAPYTPERYIQLIDEAEKAGYDNLVIDTITHEWSGSGGCLEQVDSMPGTNNYTKWSKITPRHNAFVEKIIQSPLNIIVTIRGKDQYVLEDKNGKQVPKKVGLGGIQRDGVEYEYTLTFLIDQETHVATPQKDNTHLFENQYVKLTEEHGQILRQWADNGIAKVKAQASEPSPQQPQKQPQHNQLPNHQKEPIPNHNRDEEMRILCVTDEQKQAFVDFLRFEKKSNPNIHSVNDLAAEQYQDLVELLTNLKKIA